MDDQQASHPPASGQHHTYVDLPPDAEPPYEVFVSGVPQEVGKDYVVLGKALRFNRELKQEGKLGFWRWLRMFLFIAGTYRQNDLVDVTYNRGTQRLVATGLKLRE